MAVAADDDLRADPLDGVGDRLRRRRRPQRLDARAQQRRGQLERERSQRGRAVGVEQVLAQQRGDGPLGLGPGRLGALELVLGQVQLLHRLHQRQLGGAGLLDELLEVPPPAVVGLDRHPCGPRRLGGRQVLAQTREGLGLGQRSGLGGVEGEDRLVPGAQLLLVERGGIEQGRQALLQQRCGAGPELAEGGVLPQRPPPGGDLAGLGQAELGGLAEESQDRGVDEGGLVEAQGDGEAEQLRAHRVALAGQLEAGAQIGERSGSGAAAGHEAQQRDGGGRHPGAGDVMDIGDLGGQAAGQGPERPADLLARRVLVELDQLEAQLGPLQDGVDAARDGAETGVDLFEAAAELLAGLAEALALQPPLGRHLLVHLVDGVDLRPLIVPVPLADARHGDRS